MRDEQRGAPDILLVSNGHGEDEIGARVAEELARLRPQWRLQALPLVGMGSAYSRVGVELLGPRRDLPSGGLLLHSLPLLVADLRAGFLGLTASQLRTLADRRCRGVVVVGDVYSQLLAGLVRAERRFVIQTLVSAYHADGLAFSRPNRLFMERITWLEKLLMKRRAYRVYVRDGATEEALREGGVHHAVFLGNPIADRLEGAPPAALQGERRVVGLLPGSRGYRAEALTKMLAALEILSLEGPASRGAVGAVAWLGGTPTPPAGWELVEPARSEPGLTGELRRGAARVLVFEGRFADVLHASRVVVGTSGTANEQAVALGRPVVAFPVPPHYSQAFLDNQKRLLGPALTLVPPDSGELALELLRLLDDPASAERAGSQGRARIGGAGGSERIAQDIVNRLEGEAV